MIWKSTVIPHAIAPASARWSAMSGFARKTAETVSDFASIVHNLVMDVRDSYRPELLARMDPLRRFSEACRLELKAVHGR